MDSHPLRSLSARRSLLFAKPSSPDGHLSSTAPNCSPASAHRELNFPTIFSLHSERKEMNVEGVLLLNRVLHRWRAGPGVPLDGDGEEITYKLRQNQYSLEQGEWILRMALRLLLMKGEYSSLSSDELFEPA